MLISAEENIKRAAVDVKPALTPESVLTFVKKILASYLYSSKSIKFVSTQIRNKTYKHQTQIFKEIVDQLRHSLKKKKKHIMLGHTGGIVDLCLTGILHALFSSDTRHCPTDGSKSVCS